MKLLILLAFIVGRGGTAEAIQSPNLAPNPHFAFGDAEPDAWAQIYTASGHLVVARDTKVFLHPPSSLSLTGADSSANGNVSAELPDVSGKTLKIDGSVRAAGDITGAQVALFMQDGDWKPIEYRPLVFRPTFVDGVWTSFHVTTSVPANAKHSKLILLISGRGTVWLGEISVTDAAPPKPAIDFMTPPAVPPTPRGPDSPKVVGISAVAPDVLEVDIHAGHIIPSSLSIYRPQPGDDRIPKGRLRILKRLGVEIGWLIGANHDRLETYERYVGDLLQPEYANWLGSYALVSSAGGAPKPIALDRKSKPIDWEMPPNRFAMDHRIYLHLSGPLRAGQSYTLNLGKLNVAQPSMEFVFNPAKLVSEAVHVSEVGYRPDDPFKRAYLSCWRGTGGGQTYGESLTYRVVDSATGRAVYSGAAVLGKAASEPEHMVHEENYVRADVYWMDFSKLSAPGKYRVVVDGIGCSYDFRIDDRVWDDAFKIQMRGLVNERSGIELKPPYADFVRPADEMPNPGQLITESTYSALNGAEGEGWKNLEKGDTGKSVPGAHGGYHDAGDWNPRRATHLAVNMAHLELLDIFPAHFAKLHLGLPDSSNVPDVLQEALFELSLFYRLQKPDGGIPYGLETNGDPEDGDISWLTTMHLYEFACDSYASWTYAAAAARAARLLRSYDPKLAKEYEDSAVRAMKWGEAHYAEERSKLSWEKIDMRNLAAVEVYWLTRDPHWHAVFMENTLLTTFHPNLFQYGKAVQRDAAFVYARLPKGLGDPTLKQNAKDGLVAMADRSLAYAVGNAFNLTTPDKGRPFIVGFYTEADVSDLCRAHYLTHDPKYLAGVVRGCQFSTGANPENAAFTTGLGAHSIEHPLLLDSRRTGQPAPKGLTVYGPIDFVMFHDEGTIWPMTYFLNRDCIPPAKEWPIPEAYFDIYLYPMINEFTVDNWASNVYAWGYLAARPSASPR